MLQTITIYTLMLQKKAERTLNCYRNDFEFEKSSYFTTTENTNYEYEDAKDNGTYMCMHIHNAIIIDT